MACHNVTSLGLDRRPEDLDIVPQQDDEIVENAGRLTSRRIQGEQNAAALSQGLPTWIPC